MLIHDGFSSIGVTLALLGELALNDGWSYAGRAGSLVAYRRAPATRLSNAIGHAASLPWFIRNLTIKLAVLTGQRWLSRALGHDGEWPF